MGTCHSTQNIMHRGVLLLFFVSLLALTSLFSLTRAAQETVIIPIKSTQTLTPSPIPTPTRSVPLSILTRQLVFAGVGGAGGFCYGFWLGNGPKIMYQRTSWEGVETICLAGFQESEAKAKIFDPNNRLVATIPFYIHDLMQYESDENNNTLYVVELIPLTYLAPLGQWSILVEGPQTYMTATFNHPDSTRSEKYTVAKFVPSGTPWYDSRRTTFLKAGDTLEVDGCSPYKNTDIPVLIYRQTPGSLRDPIVAQMAHTNNYGIFSAGFAITSQFTPGEYYVIVNPGPSKEQIVYLSQYSFKVIQPSQVCSKTMPSLLQKDHDAIVSAGSPNNVREKPGLKSRLIGKLNEYERVDIIAGPKCADGMVWWKVYSYNTGLDGWTSEGQGGDYWLNSIKPRF